MISFQQMFGEQTPPRMTVDSPSVGNCSPQLLPEVGTVLPHKLTDGERECAIALAASLICHHIELWEISGCFTDRANADRARLSMEALIAGRKVNAE